MIGGLAYDVDPILMWQIAGFSALVVAAISLISTTVLMIRRSGSPSVEVEL